MIKPKTPASEEHGPQDQEDVLEALRSQLRFHMKYCTQDGGESSQLALKCHLLEERLMAVEVERQQEQKRRETEHAEYVSQQDQQRLDLAKAKYEVQTLEHTLRTVLQELSRAELIDQRIAALRVHFIILAEFLFRRKVEEEASAYFAMRMVSGDEHKALAYHLSDILSSFGSHRTPVAALSSMQFDPQTSTEDPSQTSQEAADKGTSSSLSCWPYFASLEQQVLTALSGLLQDSQTIKRMRESCRRTTEFADSVLQECPSANIAKIATRDVGVNTPSAASCSTSTPKCDAETSCDTINVVEKERVSAALAAAYREQEEEKKEAVGALEHRLSAERMERRRIEEAYNKLAKKALDADTRSYGSADSSTWQVGQLFRSQPKSSPAFKPSRRSPRRGDTLSGSSADAQEPVVHLLGPQAPQLDQRLNKLSSVKDNLLDWESIARTTPDGAMRQRMLRSMAQAHERVTDGDGLVETKKMLEAAKRHMSPATRT